jgi:hypothetical protein
MIRLWTKASLGGDHRRTEGGRWRLLTSAALTVSLLAGSVAVGSPSVSALAAGEVPASNGPHVALARVNEAGTWAFCSGTVIAPHWVLTAAHCLDFSETWPHLGELRILTDTLDVYASSGRAVAADRIVMAPPIDGFRAGMQVDAALVRLTEPITGIAYPVLSRTSSDTISQVRTFGFGYNGVDSGKLTFGDRELAGSQEGFFFTTSSANAMCPGDSGGATMHGDLLLGVSSFIYSLDGRTAPVCAPGGSGGGHVMVELLVPWITSTIATPDPVTSCPALDDASSKVPAGSRASVRVGEVAATCPGAAAPAPPPPGGGRPAPPPAGSRD